MTEDGQNPPILPIQKNVGFEMNQTNRSLRLYEMMDDMRSRKLTWEDFLRIKYDHHYPQHVTAPFKHFEVEEIFHMNEADYPDIADAIAVLKRWAVKRDGSIADTNATLLYHFLYRTYFSINDSLDRAFEKDNKAKLAYFAAGLKLSRQDMLNEYGKLCVPLGEYQRHIRDTVDLPTNGGPDMWNAKYGDNHGKGKIWIRNGESHILLARWAKGGGLPQLRTISCYGSSNTKGSKHYTDQMHLYVNEQTKEESLSKEWAYKHAERIYHPGE
jgi:acyl-homoserine-lactone acylase